jgi:hypothetical protein
MNGVALKPISKNDFASLKERSLMISDSLDFQKGFLFRLKRDKN